MELGHLNDKQKEAVMTVDGPVLVLAGAGSGKTTVLVNRIGYILENKNVYPGNILAITFTNKAANEMKVRIEKLIGETAADMWIATFHSICVRILRSCIEQIGFSKNFVIYDSDDTKTVIKDCLKELNLDEKVFPPRYVSSLISKAKDELIGCDEYCARNLGDYRLSKISQVYSLYQKKLKKNNAVDFDDIIYFTVKIFEEFPDILQRYQNKFKYILVDEYQDTSTAQYMLISLLSRVNKNICVVGDDDQSIYKFRGANIRNILDFEKEFSDAKTIKLEQNYRSSKSILDAANAVIKNNSQRKDKALWTDNEVGESVELYSASNEHDEARFVASKISEEVKKGIGYSDFSILYRTNSQSRVLEEAFMKNGIPYRILSGLRFYDRKEIKDILAYLRVILNPDDDVSLLRIINEPKRGIGKTTIDKLSFLSNYHNKSIFEIINEPDKYPDIIKQSSKLLSFVKIIHDLGNIKDDVLVSELIIKLLEISGYLENLENEDTVDAKTRIENIKEFITVATEFEINEEDNSFEAFLENITLVSNIDFYDEEEEYVVMMTVHSAKGLEFNNVFVVGLEDGLFPSLKGVNKYEDEEDEQEERRLCYVALTRAKKKLYLSYADQRTIFGKTTYQKRSRFIDELSGSLKEAVSINKTPLNKYLKTAQIASFTKVTSSYEKVNENNFATDFQKGDIVLHKRFGEGVVINSKKYGNDTLVEVAFDSVGVKQLMANFAKLTKV